MTIQEALQFATKELQNSGKTTSARLDAELLIGRVLNKTRSELILMPQGSLSWEDQKLFLSSIERRKCGEPVAYILGERDFYRSTFFVGPGVLVPRPETEHIVEDVVEFARSEHVEHIMEFGVGSGCLGLSCLQDIPRAHLVGIEKSNVALEYAKKNAKALSLENRTTWFLGDVEEQVPLVTPQMFDAIVANPPYIGLGEELGAGVQDFEPHDALFSDADGFGHHFRWAKVAVPRLRPGGLLVFEIGAGQGARILKFFEETGAFEKPRIKQDLAGLDRRIWAIRRGEI